MTEARRNLTLLPRGEGEVEVELAEAGETTRPPALETSLLSALGDAVIVADEGSRIVYANPVTEFLLGWPAADLQGRPLTTIVSRRFRQALLLAFEHCVVGGQGGPPGRALRVPVVRMDGTEVHVELVLSQMWVEDGRRRLLLASIRDVAAGVELERRSTVAQELVEVLSQGLGRTEAIARTLQALGDALGWEVVALWTVDLEQGCLHWEQLWHSRPADRFEAACAATTIRPGMGLPGRVWESGEPAWIDDLAADSDFPRAAAGAAEGLRSAFAFPVVAGGRLLGVVELFSGDVRHPDPDLLSTMAAIGSQLGEFLERLEAEEERRRLLQSERAARMEAERARAEAERVEQRLAVLAEAGKVLGSSLDYRRTLQDLSELGLGILGEMCVVALVDGSQRLTLVGSAHLDPAKRALLEELRDVPLTACSESEAVVRTGTARVLEKVDDETLQGEFDSDAHCVLVRKLQLGPTMIVPLPVRQHTIGVLVLSAPPGSEPYTPTDVALAKELARRAAVAVDNARLFAETSEVARILQQSLLPPHLPQIPGVDIAARYHPAGERLEVGGDFYDAFSIGEDCWGFIIGDVAGKGPGAAATTAIVRHTARVAARQAVGLDVPAAVNEALLEAEQEERFSTMIFGRLRFVGGDASLDLFNCGHPAPLLVRSDGRIDEVECRGPLLGQLPAVKPDPVTLTLLPGDVLVLVTDGVLEARAPASGSERGSLRFFGHEGLMALLTEMQGEPAETVARRIEERTVAFSGGSLADDLAVLVLRILDR